MLPETTANSNYIDRTRKMGHPRDIIESNMFLVCDDCNDPTIVYFLTALTVPY